jgi:hypothetical protein
MLYCLSGVVAMAQRRPPRLKDEDVAVARHAQERHQLRKFCTGRR